jgi:hypothetical protein
MVCEVCESGGCTACDVQSDELQFASMKEIEEFYNVNGEALHMDPAEMDLEGMIQEMIDSEINFDREYRPDNE